MRQRESVFRHHAFVVRKGPAYGVISARHHEAKAANRRAAQIPPGQCWLRLFVISGATVCPSLFPGISDCSSLPEKKSAGWLYAAGAPSALYAPGWAAGRKGSGRGVGGSHPWKCPIMPALTRRLLLARYCSKHFSYSVSFNSDMVMKLRPDTGFFVSLWPALWDLFSCISMQWFVLLYLLEHYRSAAMKLQITTWCWCLLCTRHHFGRLKPKSVLQAWARDLGKYSSYRAAS